MLKSNAPVKFTVPFAASGAKNTIPITASSTPGLASYTTGFPATTMEPIASGGIPPAGQDFNGLLNAINTANLWDQSGFVSAFDSAFSGNASIGGYPAQSLVTRADGKGFWLNTSDNNTTNPDASSPNGWLAVRANAGTSTIAIGGATTTPDPSVLGAPVLILTGTLTANAALVLPLTSGASWIIENNTTGAFNLTVQGATGSGIQVASGNPSQVYTDGTNFYATTANVSGLYLPINGTAVAATKLATARTLLATSGPVTWAESAAFDGTSNITFTTAIANNALSIAMVNGLSSQLATYALISGQAFTGAISAVGISSSSTLGVTGLSTLTGGLATAAATATNLTVNVGALGSGQFSQNNAITLTGTDTNTDELLVGLYRGTAGSAWQDASWRIQRKVDATLLSYMQFGIGDGVQDGIIMGSSSTSLSILSSGVSIVGNLTNTGTLNFGTSDETLKDHIDRSAKPEPLHHLAPFTTYRRWDTGEFARDLIAQDLRKAQPMYVKEDDFTMPDGTVEKKLFAAKGAVALEVSYWAAYEVDKLWEEIRRLRRPNTESLPEA